MENLDRLLKILCDERGEAVPQKLTERQKADWFRALCNVRPPMPVSEEFLLLQNEYLTERAAERGVVDVEQFVYRDRIALWQGDITRLKADAIVNACNPALLGCFEPLHSCIDNVIHSNAGVQVRLDCHALMQGKYEPNGRVRVTAGYNLPYRWIVHTVGPIVRGAVTERDRSDLKSCYLACLNRAAELNLHSLAFCCLSTGVYSFPNEEAADIAVYTVREWLNAHPGELRVIFDVYLDKDREIYERELF